MVECRNLPPDNVVPVRFDYFHDVEKNLESEVKALNLSCSVDLLNALGLIDVIYGGQP